MAYIKEPPGVDFVIKSKPLSNKERLAISEFIKEYKVGNKAKKKSTLPSSKTK